MSEITELERQFASEIAERRHGDDCTASDLANRLIPFLAEVRRQAAEEALLKAEDAVSELIDGYESTTDEMRGRSEWVDSNRYSNYAAGLSMAAGSIRTLAAEYKKAEG